MAKDYTSVKFWISIIFIVILFFTGMRVFLNDLWLNNTEANIDSDSESYIASLNSINLSEFNSTTVEDIEKDSLELSDQNDTGESLKDQAIEFLYGKTQGSKVMVTIKNIYNVPTYIVVWFGIPVESVSWIINTIAWFLVIVMLIVGYYFLKGSK